MSDFKLILARACALVVLRDGGANLDEDSYLEGNKDDSLEVQVALKTIEAMLFGISCILKGERKPEDSGELSDKLFNLALDHISVVVAGVYDVEKG